MKLFIWWQRWLDSMIKTKRWWILPCQPHSGETIFIPHHEVRLGGLGLERENTQPCVFLPVQKGVMQKPLLQRCTNFSPSQSVDRDARISTAWGTESRPLWVGTPRAFGREKGFPFPMIKSCVALSLPCWKCLTRTKEPVHWMMEAINVL